MFVKADNVKLCHMTYSLVSGYKTTSKAGVQRKGYLI